MVEPVVLVHGGAGNVPLNQIHILLEGVQTAARAGYKKLQEGHSAVDAVQAAVKTLEDNANFNAGHGAVVNEDGEVEMDAIIMDGTTLKVGAVGAIRCVSNPIDVARTIMEKSPHTLLVGDGARKFANQMGIPDVPMDEMVSPSALAALKEYNQDTQGTRVFKWYGGVGTVGAVAVDAHGHVACATSTGGTTGKAAGRVGDTPLPGCGGYSDNQVGAVSTTGHGESISKTCLAYEIISLMKQGMSAQDATQLACDEMAQRVGNAAGAITVSNKGDIGVGFSAERMTWAYVKSGGVHYGFEKNKDFVVKY